MLKLEKQYSRETLKKHIYALNLKDILRTQHLDVTFVVRYILNKNYQLLKEEEITSEQVLFFQPHISKKDLKREMEKYTSDDDSVEDFDTVSKREA